jgi:hypothetical protein
MNDVLDVELNDQELTAEIALVADLMVAAGRSEGTLDQRAIDEVLGTR